jgi:O-antigen ligase
MRYSYAKIAASPEEGKYLIRFFSLWSVVLLCRPQDFIPELNSLRPALTTSIVMLCVLLLHWNKLEGPKFLHEKQVKYFLALLLVMVASIPTSLYARLSFETVFGSYIFIALYFFIFYKTVDTIEKLSLVLLMTCLGSGLYFVMSNLSGVTIGDDRLSFGSMFDPNDLAYYALVFFPLNLLFVRRDQRLLICLGCLGSLGAGLLLIFMSGSRGGVIGLASALIVLLLRTRNLRRSSKAIVLLGCVVFLAVAPINYKRFATMGSIGNDYNMNDEMGRLAIWKIGINALLANPITGVGVMCFSNAVGLDREARGAETRAWQAPHNSAIQIGTETGVFGLALFLVMNFNVIRIFSRVRAESRNEALVRISEMGLVGFVGMFTASMFLSQAYSIQWAFYVVFSAVVNRMLSRELNIASKCEVLKYV